jgi:hypothetical protein
MSVVAIGANEKRRSVTVIVLIIASCTYECTRHEVPSIVHCLHDFMLNITSDVNVNGVQAHSRIFSL